MLEPYGPNVELIKHECVSHIQKRMGTALKKLKKSGAVDEHGRVVKFKGKLTDKTIKQLNVYYGGDIKNNKGNVDGMVKAIDASFLHSVSTDTHSLHMKCPEHNPESMNPVGASSKLQLMKKEHHQNIHQRFHRT